jgi:HEPN domain-containing protein
MTLAASLLKIAVKDIEVSELLHSQKHYSQSYFYFQQAAEKANKAFGLICEIITEEECLKINHDSLKIYRRSLDTQKNNIDKHLKSLSRFPHLEPDPSITKGNTKKYHKTLSSQISFIDSLKNINLTDISTSDLNYLLDSLWDIYEYKFSVPSNFDEKINETFNSIIEWTDTFPTIEAKQEKIKYQEFYKNTTPQEFRKIMRGYIKWLMEVTLVGQTLYYCALLTIQHSSKTRYPTKGNSESPLTTYIGNIPIIRKQPEFLYFLRLAIRKLNRLVRKSEKDNLNKED